MLSGLLNGNMDALQGRLQQALADPSHLELARQQMISNPVLAQTLGISEELLNDPEKWASLMTAMTSALNADGSNEEVNPVKRNSFAKARAA
jgi:hypothetical protein